MEDNGDDIDITDEDLATAPRRRDIDQSWKLNPDNDDISDYVRFRLWLARQLAMARFEQIQARA